MSAAVEDRTDQKAGWCNNCRGDMHSLCGSPTCKCPDMRRHRSRPGFGQTAPAVAPVRDARPTKPVAPKAPVFRLVQEEPPEPPVKPPKLSLVAQAVLLAEGIADTEWWSVVECVSQMSAGQLASKCRAAQPAWEWKAADAKVFVRKVAP